MMDNLYIYIDIYISIYLSIYHCLFIPPSSTAPFIPDYLSIYLSPSTCKASQYWPIPCIPVSTTLNLTVAKTKQFWIFSKKIQIVYINVTCCDPKELSYVTRYMYKTFTFIQFTIIYFLTFKPNISHLPLVRRFNVNF